MRGEVCVRNARRLCRTRKPRLRVEVAVRVDVDDVRLPLRIHAQVDPPVVTALQGFEGFRGHRDTPTLELGVQHRGLRRAVHALGALGVPLGRIRQDPRPLGKGRSKLNFGQRKRATRRIAQHRHVHFAPVDEALDQRRLFEGPQHPAHGTTQTSPVGHHRVEVDAHRRVFTRRFHDERKRQFDPSQVFDVLDDTEARGGDPAGTENLFGLVLVQGERQRQRRRPGIRHTHQVQHRRHEHLAATVRRKRLAQVDDDVGPSPVERVMQGEQVLFDRHGVDLVTSLLEDQPNSRGDIEDVRARFATGVVLEHGVVMIVKNGDMHARRGTDAVKPVYHAGRRKEHYGVRVRIRDPIHGTITLSEQEKLLIDSRHYQRLRHVRQLGFGDLAFPGATHTRHSHSLGAMHVASRLFDALTARVELSPTSKDRFRAAVRLAVLSHDLGHMPLSHASESIAPMRQTLGLPTWMGAGESPRASHEDFTARILLDSSLSSLIERVYGPMDLTPVQVAGLVTGHFPTQDSGFTDRGLDWTPALRAIVSGELDADRMDYLMRDSFFTGVNYGRFDLEWLLQNLSVEQREGRVVMALLRAGVFAFEDFLLSRYHMFLSVYYHHTSVSFDYMLRRYYEEAPGEFEIPADPEAFLECDDMALHLTLRRSKNEWAQRIVTRRGYRRVAQFTELDEDYDLDTLSNLLTGAGIDHFTIESRGVLSRYFDEGHGTSLFVIDRATGRLTEVSKYTPLYKRFASAVRLSRVYVRPDQLDAARPIVARATAATPPGAE